MIVKLNNFLSNGKFGKLKLGDSKEFVLQILSKPDYISAEGIKDLIWKYGNVEITFGIGGVVSIFLDLNDTEFSHKIEILDYTQLKGMNIQELKTILDTNNIPILRDYFVEEDEGKFFLPNLVNITFEENILTSCSVCNPKNFI